MIEQPDPLVPTDVDLRDFGYMPLDVLRLRDSDLASLASGEEFRAAVLLWCASWHQVPAGSVPDDDRLLTKYSGTGDPKDPKHVARWKKLRPEALRGFVKCSDGRLYHETVAEKALEAVAAKSAQRARTKAASEAKDAKRKAEQALRDAIRVEAEAREIGPSQALVVGRHDDRDGDRDDHRDGDRHGSGDDDRDDIQGKGRESKGREGKGEKTEKKKPSASSAGPTIPCPYDEIVALYHEALPSLPKVKLMTPDRQRAMRKVWGWVLRSTKSDGGRRATSAAEALEWIAGYFRRAAENDFLMGRTQRAAEHAGWKCDLDFLLTDRGMKQVIEKTAAAA
jgi:hypothetical protein